MPSLGLISDPDFPDQIARSLAETLPDRIGEQLDGDQEWTVQVHRDPVAAGRSSGEEILRAARKQREHQGWDYAICVTDLPLRTNGRPVLADVGVGTGVAVISLPALGGLQPYRRARQMTMQILDELIGQAPPQTDDDTRRRGLHSMLTELLAPIRRECPGGEEIGIRYSATRHRGRLRLLSGMVRSNTPWRLVLGMSSALAASVAASAFGLISATVWQIGDVLGPGRKTVIILGVLAVMTAWLVLSHNLWDKRSQSHDREQQLLYNASTVTTVGTGVGVLYAALFVINVVASLFLIDPGLLSSKLGHPAAFADYLDLAWASTSMGVAAGALGSGFEDDAAVRQAAYGYRESQRRAEQQD